MATNEPVATSLQDLRRDVATPREVSLPAIDLGFATLQSFEFVQRAAKLLAASTLIPAIYQNNVPNCVIALNMANRMKADPLMVMQNLYVVHGKPGWSSQFLIATFNCCGRFSALRYEFFGNPKDDSWGCRAWAVEKDTGEKLVGSDVTIAMAKAEKWVEKNGSKWQTMPQQMLQYRAAAFFVRTYSPELSMGLHTAEEIKDIGPIIDAEYSTSVEDLKARAIPAGQPNPQAAAPEPKAAETKKSVAIPPEQTQLPTGGKGEPKN